MALLPASVVQHGQHTILALSDSGSVNVQSCILVDIHVRAPDQVGIVQHLL